MRKIKRYPYKGNEYSIDYLAAILSRKNEKSISATTLKKYLSLIEYKYYKDGNFNKFKDGIVEEAYDNFLYSRYLGSKVKLYPYKDNEYTAERIVSMLKEEGIHMSVTTLKKYLSQLEDKYKIEGEERRFRKGIVQEACYLYIEKNRTRVQRKMNERE